MGIEVEIKLRIDDDGTVRRIYEDPLVHRRRLEEWRDISMQSAYFDTPENDLYRRKWTLRRRLENDSPVIAFKQMGFQEESLFSREEWQIQGDDIDAALPLLVQRGAPKELLGFSGFSEQCSVTFIRHAVTLRLAGGSVVEVSIDRGHIRGGDKTMPMLELELELLAGEPEEMVSLAADWQERYGLSKEYYSKYMRAIRLMRPEED